MKKQSFKELGFNLPVGILDPTGSGFVKEYAIKRYTFKDDKKLAKRREDSITAGRFASEVISRFVEHIGGKTFDEMKPHERTLFVNRLWMADAMALYFAIRIKAKGRIFKPMITCPFCQNRFRDIVDLETTMVRVIDDPADLETEFDFTETYTAKVGETDSSISKAVLQPPRWSEIEMITPEEFSNDALILEGILKGAIKTLGELDEATTKAVLATGFLDDLSKLDVDDLSEFINEKAPGLEMVIDTRCKRCRSSFSQMLDWNYDAFFATSSRSGDGRKS